MSDWTGGTRKNWISDIAKGPEVAKVMKQETTAIKKLADRNVNALRHKDFKFHWGMGTAEGPWGPTVIMWPTNPLSLYDHVSMEKAIATTAFKKKGSA